MSTKTDTLELHDFGMGLLAGLHTREVKELDERELANLHAAFADAFKVVEIRLGRKNLGFSIVTHRVYGTSGDVFSIFRHWLGIWATNDSPDTLWKLSISDQTVERLFAELPGGREVYVRAADAFLVRYRGY